MLLELLLGYFPQQWLDEFSPRAVLEGEISLGFVMITSVTHSHIALVHLGQIILQTLNQVTFLLLGNPLGKL